jgi:small subunit ribosomal protein S17
MEKQVKKVEKVIAPESDPRNSRKVLQGEVTSDKMQKTITVKVANKTQHPIFKKGYIKHKKYHVHDELEEANVGDTVRFSETRPLSATKR